MRSAGEWGQVSAGRGDREAALPYYREALVIYEDLGFAALTAAVRTRINELR